VCFLAVKTSLFSCSSTRTSSSSTCGSWWSSQDCQTVPRKTKEMSARSKKRSTFRDKKKRPFFVVREKINPYLNDARCARVSSLFPRLNSFDKTFFSLRPAICEREELLSNALEFRVKERGERGSEREREDGSDTKGVCRFFFVCAKFAHRACPLGEIKE